MTPTMVLVPAAAALISVWLSRPLDGGYRVTAMVGALVIAIRAVEAAGGACYATISASQLTLWEPYQPTALNRRLRFGTVDIGTATTVTSAGRAWWGEQLVQVVDETGRTIIVPRSVLRWAQGEVRRDARLRAPGVWPPS